MSTKMFGGEVLQCNVIMYTSTTLIIWPFGSGSEATSEADISTFLKYLNREIG